MAGSSAELPASAGATVHLTLPEGAAPEPPSDLPAVDVANLPGASVPLRAGYRAGEVTVRVACATAPSSGWAPGVAEIVLGRANQIARGAMGGEVTRFEPRDALAVGSRFEQRFEAGVMRGGRPLDVRGRHVLGFVGTSRDGMLCTVACAEPRGGDACEGVVAGADFEAPWVAPPPPSLLVRGILLGAEAPWEAAGALGLAALALAAWILARRPRPRARSPG